MSPLPTRPLPPGWSLGPVLILLGVLAIGFAPEPHRLGLGDNQDPGPRAVPLVLAFGLITGGVAEIVKAWVGRRRLTRSAGAAARKEEDAAAADSSDAQSLGDAAVVLVLVVGYVAALPWLGFSLSTSLLVVALLLRLGARWMTAAVAAVVLVLAVRLLFVGLFKVQLPVGQLGLPF
jgi:putative tricarboxylic transport membrane protein